MARDDQVDIDFPFFHVHVGGEGGTRVRFGEGDDDDEVIEMQSDDSGDYWEVRRSVRARLRFVRHLFTYLAFNGFFVLIDWATGGAGSGINWSQWVALVWGVFIGWEFISKFVAPTLWGRDMEERLVQRELRRRRGA
jgi:hypothetical protein